MNRTATSFFFGYLEFELQGDASLCADGYLSLTKPTRGSVGRVLYSPIIKFFDNHSQLNFDTIFTFQVDHINGPLTVDSIVFFIAPVQQGASGGSLAIPSTGYPQNSFAVKFAIDDKGQITIKFDVPSWESCNPPKTTIYIGKRVTAKISYRGHKVSVVAVTDDPSDGATTASADIDLKTVLDQLVQVGISASSINCVENHYVYTWSFNSVLAADAE